MSNVTDESNSANAPLEATSGATDETFKRLFPRKYLCKCIEERNSRTDSRSFNEMRNLTVEMDTVSTADASATVTIGQSKVLVGIKVEISEPNINEPACGFLEVNVNMTPFCGLRHEFGKSSDEALAIAEFIRRTLIGCNIFDLQDLCIEEHKSVWTVHLDCMCLSDGGSIIDCALLGSGVALSRLVLPALVLSPSNQLVRVNKSEISRMSTSNDLANSNGNASVSLKSHGKKLPVSSIPISLTFGVFRYKDRKILFTDPCDEEEPLLENSFTVVCCLNRDDLSVYKQGGPGLDVSIIQEAFGLTKGRYDQVARIETLSILEVQK